MLTFEPHQLYRSTYKRYPELWTAVSSPKACLLMRSATLAGYPAVLQLDTASDIANLITFIDEKEPSWSDPVRSLIGYMCRQVMEQLDYELIKEDVPISDSTIFKSGALYQRIDHKKKNLEAAIPPKYL
ncbi:MAG: hypothetical protein F4077_09490 [Gammaproteobacteria bacterium]|nr:hypothetical protein [Gammaproteobacteria bacterium]